MSAPKIKELFASLKHRISGPVRRQTDATVEVDSRNLLEGDERLRLQLVASVVLLTAFGYMLVYSAMSVRLLNRGEALLVEAAKIGAFTLLGLFGFWILSRFRLSWLERLTWLIWGVAYVLQWVTYFRGNEIGGNRNWLQVGPITLQPSELLKVGFIMVLAWMLTRFPIEIRRGIGAFVYLTLAFAITVLPILLCSDLGSVIIFGVVFILMLIIAGVDFKYVATVLIGGGVVMGVLVGISPSRRTRVLSVVYSFLEVVGLREAETGFSPPTQIDRARYAVGMGGLLGQGPGGSHEKWLYLPTADSDFIFAILCEEYGFVGAVMVILLFIVLVSSIITIAIRTSNMWAKLVCMGAAGWIGFQAAINMSVVLGVAPPLGVPLPFISRGYSSLLSLLAICGMVWACANVLPGVQKLRKRRGSYSGRTVSVFGKTKSARKNQGSGR